MDSDPLAIFTWTELLLRLGAASLIGLLLGLDRELRATRRACAPMPWSP